MNIHSQPARTPAETALIAAFGERMSDLPGDSVVTIKRDEAIERIKAGLPTRRIESWHYTDLRRLLTSVPQPGEAAAAPLAALVDGSAVLTLVDGAVAGSTPAVEGLHAQPLSEKLIDGSFAPALDMRGDDDAIGALNAAFVSDGWLLDIAADAVLPAPVELQNVHGGGQSHVRMAVRAGKNAKATIVERQSGSGDALVSSVSHLTLAPGADILWVIFQEQPATATQLAQFNAEMGHGARLTLLVVNAGGKLVRQEVLVKAAGEGGEFKLRAVNLLSGASHTDLTMVLDHAVPGTTSTEIVRNVVTDRAHGVFQGRINVAPLAQKTDAKMACNTLLLSDDAEFSAKPELEIFADDVACGHGATVTEIDANHLFYLMARGIDEKSARGLLVKAFIAEIIEELEDEVLVEALENRLATWFAEHG
ncbi:MAG: Fe-S cluster assembly protein SufD [Rhizobiaceae bacterium]|nr:Fe-S cluster assembly protein SufD [Rhizobiaceae bacterium]